ncbi:toxic anion resistance protein [Neofamilia massiliensis]|uniref:toxic anion resistance protein n=1 Tax=Neofamilia massiliensis TaxID=1673724 RepID=UPI0006BB76A0|nr:toxic anion resistance protein [Neofamilia massiliensis]
MDYKDISLKDLAKAKEASAENEIINEEIDIKEESEIIERKVMTLSPEDREKVDKIKSEINLMDSSLSINYGVGAQKALSEFSGSILTNVRNKDSGEVGKLLTELMVEVKSLEINELGEKKGIFSNLPFVKDGKKKMDVLLAKYDSVDGSIEKIQDRLDTARTDLVRDITVFDQLYEKNFLYFKDIQAYIVAGEEVIADTKDNVLPRLRNEAAESGDQMDAQLVKDFEDTLNRFEKKVYDLKLSKAMAIQAAPQIRLIQNNDKLLVDKIQTAMLNTIPLWKSQVLIAIGLQNQDQALKLQREISDTTNELLRKNSKMLRENTKEVLKESERGIVDLETLKVVNQDLIKTLEEGILIQRDGRKKRLEAERDLAQLEDQLRAALLKNYSLDSGSGGEDK